MQQFHGHDESNEDRFLRRMKALSEQAGGKREPPAYVIMVLDRSDPCLAEYKEILWHLDGQGLSSVIPREPREWIKNPSLGAFLVVVLNRIDKTSAYMGDDDLFDLLSTIPALMEEFYKRTAARGRITWAPMLCPELKEHFMRWFNTQQ